MTTRGGMLHNSLFRRELLLSMNRNPLVLKRRDVHRNVGVRGGAKPASGQVVLEGAWAIQCARNVAAEKLVAGDAEDFLKRLDVKIDPAASKKILLEVGSAEKGFRCVATAERVEVHASDAAALWAGWVHLENQMRAAGAAIV